MYTGVSCSESGEHETSVSNTVYLQRGIDEAPWSGATFINPSGTKYRESASKPGKQILKDNPSNTLTRLESRDSQNAKATIDCHAVEALVSSALEIIRKRGVESMVHSR